MGLIGSLFPLGWSLRGWSEFCPLGLSHGLFSIFGVDNWIFLGSSVLQILACVFGGYMWGIGFGSGPSLWGGHECENKGLGVPIVLQ